MSLPYKDHPLYSQRRALLITAGIGILLDLTGISSYDPIPSTVSIFLLAISATFSFADLSEYAVEKVKHPDQDPKWPLKRYMIGDIILSVVLQFMFWAGLEGYGRNPLALYGNLGNFVASILHGYCFRRELMARYEAKWLARHPQLPCARCGFHEAVTEPDPNAPNVFVYTGPSADFREANILTPESPESAMESGLLIGSDFGGSYGSVDRPEPTLEQPDEVLVSKKKQKKSVTENKKAKASSS